jgi:hypothetical protein
MSASVFFAASLASTLLYLIAPDAWLLDPFGFREQPVEVLWQSVLLFAMTWIAAVGGHWLAGNERSRNPPLRRSPVTTRSVRRPDVLVMLTFSCLSAYIVGSILLAADSIGDTALDDRVFIDKSSQYVLLGYGAAAYASIRRQRPIRRALVESAVLVACFLIAVVDMSREALIPAAFMLAFYLQRPEHRLRLLAWCAACALLLALVMFRRDFNLSDVFQQQLDVVVVYLIEAVGYITAFNVLHFGQVVADGMDTGFSWLYLALSVIPLPSALIGADVLESRNFDAFRPYGASADMFSLSPIVLCVYWALFGWAARRSTSTSGMLRVLLAALLLILFVTSFQYPLRTSSKFFILVLLALAFRRLLRRRTTRKGRESAARSGRSSTLAPLGDSRP